MVRGLGGSVTRPIATTARRDEAVQMLEHALLLLASVVPLAAMLAALFAAVWIREGQREAEARARAPHRR